MTAIRTDIGVSPPPPAFDIDRAPLAGLTERDRHLFTHFASGPRVEPHHHLVHEAFETWARRQPHAVAIEHLGATITYGELDAKASRLAAELVARGIGAGDDVCLFLRRGIAMVTGILATLKVGAAYVPQDVAIAPEPQLRHVLAATGAEIVLTERRYRHKVPSADAGQRPVTVVAIDDVRAEAGFTPSGRPATPDDRCFVLFTSGTTGQPNGVQVTHANVANILFTAPGDLGIGPGVRVAHILNISFDMAAWEILGCLGNGGTLLIRGEDFQAVANAANVVIATPTVLGRIDSASTASVFTVAVAGEPCPRPLAEEWASRATFYNSCGPTETTIVNTASPFEADDALLTIGAPTPNNTVYVLDEERRPLPIGQVGEMWAGGDCVTAGYLHNEELTAERYAPDPFLGGGRMMFRTRDLGRWTSDGRLLHYGRTDDQVKVRGFRVELDSVSRVLEGIDGCHKAVTLKLDEANLIAAVTPSTVDAEAARAAVAEQLPYYCVPTVILAMDEMPMTARGKVDKRTLLAIAGERSAS